MYLNKLEERNKDKLKRKNEETIGIKENPRRRKKKEEEVSETSSIFANLSNENSMNSESYIVSKKKDKQTKKMKFV